MIADILYIYEPVACVVMGSLFSVLAILLFPLQDFGVGGYIFGHPNVSSDDSIVAYGDASEDGAIAIDDDIIFEDGMAVDALDRVAL